MERREIIIPVVYYDGDVLLYRVMATEEQIRMIEESDLSGRVGTDEDFEEIFGGYIGDIGEYIESPATIRRD